MLKNYLKIAFKVFLRRKFFTFVSLFGICFTLTVLMVVAAYIDRFVSPYPPEVHADRTLMISRVMLARSEDLRNRMGYRGAGTELIERYVRRMETPEKIAVFSGLKAVVAYRGAEKFKLSLKHADAAYWEILEFNFLEGQPFTAQEVADETPVAVITRATRQKLFEGGPAVGRTLETLSSRYRVVGVVENVPDSPPNAFADFWVPLGKSASPDPLRLLGDLQVLLLARSKSDVPRIKAEYRTLLSQIDLSGFPRYDVIKSAAQTPFESLAWEMAGGVDITEEEQAASVHLAGILTGAALLFMLLPALNLINLNVSRILERAPEIGVRKAFGARSWTLVGQFVVENLLLTLIGGGLSLFVSMGLLGLVAWIGLGWGWSEYSQLQLNFRLFFYGLALAVAFGLLSGVYPAWRMSRLHPAEALRGGQR